MIFLSVVWGNFWGNLITTLPEIIFSNHQTLSRSKVKTVTDLFLRVKITPKFHHRIFHRKDVGHPEKS